MKIATAVKRLYKSNKISPLQFACKHYAECRQGCRNFTPTREPFIGREYENSRFRLLFISLNPPRGSKQPQHRTVQSVRRWEENECHRKHLPHQRHWYRTHEFACKLLEGFLPEIEVENACRFFAHTNSAKCTTNEPGGRQGLERLFRNCEEYLQGEIDTFHPDIIVTQGNMARRGVERSFPKYQVKHSSSLECSYRILKIRHRRVLWIHTSHPRNFGAFNRERRDYWGYWARVTKNFFRN